MTEKEEFESLSRTLQMDIMLLKAKIKKKNQRLNQLNIEISELERKLNTKNYSKSRLEKLLLLEKPFDASIISLWDKIVAAIIEQESENITKKRYDELEEQIKAFKKELLIQTNCDHRLIIGYGARYSNSEDGDEWSGYRKCLVCGKSESGKTRSYRTETYDVLMEKPVDRIIEIINLASFQDFNSKQSLPEIIEWFKKRYKIN